MRLEILSPTAEVGNLGDRAGRVTRAGNAFLHLCDGTRVRSLMKEMVAISSAVELEDFYG